MSSWTATPQKSTRISCRCRYPTTLPYHHRSPREGSWFGMGPDKAYRCGEGRVYPIPRKAQELSFATAVLLQVLYWSECCASFCLSLCRAKRSPPLFAQHGTGGACRRSDLWGEDPACRKPLADSFRLPRRKEPSLRHGPGFS